VDFVLENRQGKRIGFEVKSGASVKSTDFNGIRSLAEGAGNRFLKGIILYPGDSIVPFGKNLYAIPLTALWQNYP